MYTTPDLTKADELYKVTNHQEVIFTADQKFYFRGAVYASTIVLTQIGSINKTLVKDYDYVIHTDDIDVETMSELKMRNAEFFNDNDKIVKSITIVKPWVLDYTVAATYQRVYPVMGKVALINDEPFETNPDLIAWLIRKVTYLDQITTPVDDVTAPTLANPLRLEEDTIKERAENNILNEVHELDTPNGIHYVHPVAGAYFKSSLVIKNNNTNELMVEGIDYKCFGLNIRKTDIALQGESIYEYILFLKAFVGQVKISYHAFGGDVTLYDIKAITNNITNITDYIVNSQANAPDMTSVWTKINSLERNMRILLAGRATGADVNAGATLKLRVTSNDTDLHWYNIAYLYKVSGSDEPCKADTLHLRFQSLMSNIGFGAIINVNLLADSKLDVQLTDELYPAGYVPYENYAGLNNIIRPQFRLIYNVNEVAYSGCYLQIGFPLKGMTEETFGITNISDDQSCWMLIPSPTVAVGNNDHIVTLPANAETAPHIWDDTNTDSKSTSILMPYRKGHIAWAGSKPLNSEERVNQIDLAHILEPTIDITKITSIRFDFSEDNSNKYCASAVVVPGSENILGNTTLFYNNKPAYFTIKVYRDGTGAIKIRFNSVVEAGVSANPLYLRHVLVYTN